LQAKRAEHSACFQQVDVTKAEIAALENAAAMSPEQGVRIAGLRACLDNLYRRIQVLKVELPEAERDARGPLSHTLGDLLWEALLPGYEAYLTQATDEAVAWARDRGFAAQNIRTMAYFANRVGFARTDYYLQADPVAAAQRALEVLDKLLEGIDPYPPFDQARP